MGPVCEVERAPFHTQQWRAEHLFCFETLSILTSSETTSKFGCQSRHGAPRSKMLRFSSGSAGENASDQHGACFSAQHARSGSSSLPRGWCTEDHVDTESRLLISGAAVGRAQQELFPTVQSGAGGHIVRFPTKQIVGVHMLASDIPY